MSRFVFFSSFAVFSCASSLSAILNRTGEPWAAYTPSFRIATDSLPLIGYNGSYVLPIHVIYDDNAAEGGIVGTYIRKDSFITQTAGNAMGEINLLTHDPRLVKKPLLPIARYGWAYLFGQRLTTIPWLDVGPRSLPA